MTEREDHSLSPPVIRIKPKALSIVDTADSHTARATAYYRHNEGHKGQGRQYGLHNSRKYICLCVCGKLGGLIS